MSLHGTKHEQPLMQLLPIIVWDCMVPNMTNHWCNSWAHLEFVFQKQSYSSLHSGRSLAWDHICGDIDDPCGAISDFCGFIADPCGFIADPCGVVVIGGRVFADATPIVARLAKHHKTLLNIVKHHETHVKHHETHVKYCNTS